MLGHELRLWWLLFLWWGSGLCGSGDCPTPQKVYRITGLGCPILLLQADPYATVYIPDLKSYAASRKLCPETQTLSPTL